MEKPIALILERKEPQHGVTVALGLVVFGLGLLIVGARWLVEGASGLARRIGITPFVVGATVVGFGTRAPSCSLDI